MIGARIVDTADGPVVQIPAGAAEVIAGAVGRALAAQPADTARNPALVRLRADLLRVEAMHRAGVGFEAEAVGPDLAASGNGARTPVLGYLTAAAFAVACGDVDGRPASLRTVRHWCRTGRLPGAIRPGRDWLIPTDAELIDPPRSA